MTLRVKSMKNKDIMKVIVITVIIMIIKTIPIMIIIVKYVQSVRQNKKCSNKSNSCPLKTE